MNRAGWPLSNAGAGSTQKPDGEYSPYPPARPVEATAGAQPKTPAVVLLVVSAAGGAPFSRPRRGLSSTDALSFVYTILVAWSCTDRACVGVAGRWGVRLSVACSLCVAADGFPHILRRSKTRCREGVGPWGHCDTRRERGILGVDKRACLGYNLCAAAAHEGEKRCGSFSRYGQRPRDVCGAVLPP